MNSRRSLFASLGPVLLLILFLVGGLIFYAYLPAVPPDQLPISALIEKPGASQLSTLDRDMTVVTYNIGYAYGLMNNRGRVLTAGEVRKNLQEIVGILKGLRPDLVFLQEVDFDSARTFRTNQFRELFSALDLPFAATVITWNHRYLPWPYWPLWRQFGRMVSGQVVLSRYPILDQKLIWMDKPKTNPFWYNWFYLSRVVQQLTIATGNQTPTVFHTHLEAFDRKTRELQMERLLAVVREEPESWLVVGDFNTQNFSGLESYLKNATCCDDPFMSFPSDRPIKKIDHIFYAQTLICLQAGNVISLASDHLPIWAKFLLQVP